MGKRLNSKQIEAIVYEGGPLLIIAGAGTGKTTVITERVKYLIKKNLALPSEILSLTFTEKAAREMEERIDTMLPYGYTQMWTMTFHSFCDRVLRKDALQIGLNPNYNLLTEADSVSLVRSNLFQFDLNYFRPLGNPNKFISGIIQHFSRLQDEDISPTEYLEWVKTQKLNFKGKKDEQKLEIQKWIELSRMYKKYNEIKTKEGLMDFGDLIVKTLELFRKRPNVLAYYQKQFKYILVDEFQDVNFAQNKLAVMLAGKGNKAKITVCGDDDQSIYRFRGAAVSNIIHFKKIYPKTKVVVLTKNYRSTQQILNRAYDLIQNNNPDRLEEVEGVNKKLEAVSKSKKNYQINFIHKDRVENEADTVAKEVINLLGNKDTKLQYRDVAILVRANNHAEPFMKALAREGIPYQFLGPGKLFKQPEITELISYLKVLYNFEDSVSLYKLLSIDYFGIPPKDLFRVNNYARKYNVSIYDALERISEINISEDTKKSINSIIEIIEDHFKRTKKETAGQLVYDFLERTNLLHALLNPDTPDAERKAKNISKFFDKLKSFEATHEDGGVVSVVDWIDLATEIGESPLATDSDWTEVNAVNILTVHSAKGLEFPVVFLVNLVVNRFPSIERSEQIPIPEKLIKETLPKGDFHLQEERRLFYVGMTRAKKKLYFTAANYYGEGKRVAKLSPFIFEALGDSVEVSEFGKTKEGGAQLSILDYGIKKSDELIPTSFPPVHIDYLSYSQINTFRMCEMHYKLRYILGVATPPNSALSFGSTIHLTMKDFYSKVKIGENPSEKLILDVYKNDWVREGYLSKAHEQQMYKKGEKYLVNYLNNEFNEKRLPEALEKPFVIPLNYRFKKMDEKPLRIGGKIDRVDIFADGTIEIIDYKTGENIPDQKKTDKDLQLTFYALAATMINEPPFAKNPDQVKLSLYYFDAQEKITTVRKMEDLQDAVEEIFEWRKKIETSDFHCTNPYFCDNCEFKMFCNNE